MRTRLSSLPDPTQEEMSIYLLGRARTAYRRYRKRTGCSVYAFYQLSHLFHKKAPRQEGAKPTFPRRLGWLDRVSRRNRDGRRGYES